MLLLSIFMFTDLFTGINADLSTKAFPTDELLSKDALYYPAYFQMMHIFPHCL